MSDFSMLTGSILIGTQLNWALLGTLTLQVYIFHVSFPTERAPIKALVYTIFLLDVLQSAPSSHFAFEVLATGWGNPEALQKLPWTNAAIPVITGMVSAPVQIFFAWRIYNLRKDSRYTIVVCGLIITLALLQSSTGMAGGIKFALLTQVPSGKSDVLLILLQIWLIGSVACDVIIAVTMIIILTQYRKATPWKNTDSLITKLISHTIQTGALTSIVVILDLALFFAYSSSYFPGIPLAFILGKVYSNVMMANLNARAPTNGTSAGGSMAVMGTGLRFAGNGGSNAENSMWQVSEVIDFKRTRDGNGVMTGAE